MAIAGSIVANLIANTDAWTGNLAGAITPLNTLAMAVAGFAATGVARFVEVGSALDDMSERTGMAADQLSSLRYAAQMTDTSLESVQNGIMKMNQFLEQAAGGSQQAQATLARLNLTLASLMAMDTEQRLYAFSDALADVPDVADRATLAMKVFGKGAVDILPLLSLGADGLKTMSDEAEKLGFIMSEKDAKAAALLGDTIDKMLWLVDFAAIKISTMLTPILQDIANLLIYIASENGRWMRQLMVTGVAIAGVVTVVSTLVRAYQALVAIQTAHLLLQGPKGFLVLAAAIAATATAVHLLINQSSDMLGSLNATKNHAASAAAATNGLAQANRNATESLRAYDQAMDAALDKYHAYLPLATQIAMETNAIEASWRKAHEAGIDFALTWDQMKALQDKIVLDRSGFASEWTAVTDEVRVLRGEITETELALQRMMEAGVPADQIDRLRQMYAERDQLIADQRQADQAQQESQRRFSQIADQVRESLSTPVDDFEKQMAELRDAVLAGFVDPQDAMAFATAERDRLAKELMGPTDSAALKDQQAINEAITINSDGANRQLTSLLNRRGNQSWEAKLTDEQRKAREELEEVNAQLINTNGYLSQWVPVESRSLRGRS